MNYVEKLLRLMLITGIPMFILCIAILLNPLTGFFFTVDDALLYHRGPGVVASWIVEWAYLFAAFTINIRAVRKETRHYRKSELRGYLIFLIPMAIAAVIQMLVYGTTTAQCGYIIAIFMAYNNNQKHQIRVDDLTGLNNRNAFLNYRDSMFNRNKPVNITTMMIDADDFKKINDTCGHIKGDQALTDIADIMKASAGQFPAHNIILYRFGGDEFMIIGENLPDDVFELLQQSINERVTAVNEANRKSGERYEIGLSIGLAKGSCDDIDSFDRLIRAADTEMYSVKKSKKLER